MKKVNCKDCNGRGHITIDNIVEACQSCNANGYIVYLEESEIYGSDCKKGSCE